MINSGKIAISISKICFLWSFRILTKNPKNVKPITFSTVILCRVALTRRLAVADTLSTVCAIQTETWSVSSSHSKTSNVPRIEILPVIGHSKTVRESDPTPNAFIKTESSIRS